MMRHRIPLPSTRRSHVSAWGSADCRCIRCSSVVCALGVGTAAARLFAPALGSPIAYPRPAQLPSHIPNSLLSPKKMAKKPIQKKSKKAAKKAGGRRKKGKRSYRSYSGAQKPRVRECSDQSICKCTGACVFVLWLGAAPSWAPLYISKVVKGLQGKFKMSKKAMAIVNSFAADLFDRGQTPRWRLGCVLRLLVGASAPPFLARPAAFRPLRIAGEAGRLAKHTGAKTLSSAGMQAACRLQGSSGHPQPRHCLPGSVPTAPRPEAPSCPASWPSTP